MSENKVKLSNLVNNEPMNQAEQAVNNKIGKSVGKILPFATAFAVIGSGIVINDAVRNFSLNRLETEILNHPYIFLTAAVLGIIQLATGSKKE